MEIIQHEQQKHNILLTSDYCPNQAVTNEFQTIFSTCKLQRIELCEKELRDFIVDDGVRFLMLHVTIRNITDEILTMYEDDFVITPDNKGLFEAGDDFGIRNQLSDEYVLKLQEEISGCPVFTISSSAEKIMLSYVEYFDDESGGKTYKPKYKIGWSTGKSFIKRKKEKKTW